MSFPEPPKDTPEYSIRSARHLPGHERDRLGAMGKVLRRKREMLGLDEAELAKRWDLPIALLRGLESGVYFGDIPFANLWANALQLGEREKKLLTDLYSSLWDRPEIIEVQESAQALDDRLEGLAAKFEALAAKVDQQAGTGNAVLAKELQELRQEVLQTKQEGQQLATASRDLVAPVSLPSAEEMRVVLAPVDKMVRLEEYRAEQSQWSAWFGVFVGSVLGVLINIATGDPLIVTRAALLMLVFFVALGIVTWRFEEAAKKRGNDLIGRLLSGQAGERGE